MAGSFVKIAWIHRLHTRFILVTTFVLLLTLALSQYLLLTRQEENILQEESNRAEFLAIGLMSSLQALMLSGDATYARDWIERLSENPEIDQIQVIRTDGMEAFLDTTTMERVNAYLQTDYFDRTPLPARRVVDLPTETFRHTVQGNKSLILDKEKGKLTLLLPINRQDECIACHGYDDSPVRGVLRITTFISHAQERILEARQSSIIHGLLISVAIGLLLFLFIHFQILSPLEEITHATARIAAGDLESRITVNQKGELGMLEASFNWMVDNLQNTTVSRDYVESIMNSLGEMLFVTDTEKRIRSVNPAVVNTLGYTEEELTEKSIDIITERPYILASDDGDILNGLESVRSIECNFRKKSGDLIPVLVTVSQLERDGRSFGIVHAGRDITAQKRVERELQLAAKVMENDSNAILICDKNSNIVLVNPAFCEITGYSREEVIGKNPSILQSGRQSKEFYREMWNSILNENGWKGEIWNRRKNGEIYPEFLSITTLRNEHGEITNFVSIFTDITRQKDIEQKLAHMAHHDALTGLPNRTLFIDRLEHAIEHNRRDRQQVALMFIDIDGFKQINDKHGHDIGDRLLKDIAEGISAEIRKSDTLARIGGDEFVIILEQIHNIENVTAIADNILKLFRQPFMIEGIACNVGVSIGIAVHPDDSDHADDLVKKADTAMYHAKTTGKMKYSIFSAECVEKKE